MNNSHAPCSNLLKAELKRALDNPLLRALPAYRDIGELDAQMRHRPINVEHVAEIELDNRFRLVEHFKKIYVPTNQTIVIADGLQRLLMDGLSARDPRNAINKHFVYQSGDQHEKKMKIDALDWWPSFAKGMVVEGISGTGKSQCIDRFLQLYPQVIEHGAEDDCGWRSLKQLVYLKVHMPADGSRGGFMTAAFLELDMALGTTYAKDHTGGNKTVERQLVTFLHLLAVHRCGLLIIEEAQERNLSAGSYSNEFMTFFLRVLNRGVPTVLVGNPLAFTKLRRFSQNVDRFSEEGWHTLWPCMDPHSDEWRKEWLPNLWEPTLLPQADAAYQPISAHPLDATIEGFVWRRTAGVPRYVSRLRRAVQETALRMRHEAVTAELVDMIYKTDPRFIKLHPRIDAFTSRDWRALESFEDIPTSCFRQKWAAENAETDKPPENPATRSLRPSQKTPAKVRTKRKLQSNQLTTKDVVQQRLIHDIASASTKTVK